ncbi:hypothetical protein CIPAW_07G172200 [Carya illinoinensis]|uniref:DUF4378 domain-containing protein n=1 Tax=Carya illinoinensis TaxID=32201 RepID=A0A8T1Q648_CARIL|nr:hypothetical protein CIPAW_07G172200 [Carya illinoinensis]KAG6705344.1 hypothetical protein I3842_07G174400 [Carya illinoinensis]
MASTPPKPSKQLGEFLLEQQEPFILDEYLLERGCLKNSSNSRSNLGSCCGNSTKLLKRSASCGLNKSRNDVPRCSKILGCVYKKFVSIKEDKRRKSSEYKDEEYSAPATEMVDKEVAESDGFSSSSSTTVFNSCSESDKEEISTSSCKDQTFFDVETFQAMELCNVRGVESCKGLESLLQQTKQLLFDCVREAMETHVRRERGKQHHKELLGPEELGRLICERMRLWGKQAGDETNTNYFLDLDSDSVDEWRTLEQQKRKIALEIGDAILEEIQTEIVIETNDFPTATAF